MRYYEILYILNPNFEQEKVDSIIKEIDEQAVKFSQVINHRVLNKKRLAYPIEQHKYGTYIILQFETEKTAALKEFDNFLKLNNSVLRYQNIRLDTKPEKFEDELLDESADSIEETPQGEGMREIIEKVSNVSQEENEDAEKAAETVEEETSE